jgi:hypothetical protein
LAWRLKCEDWPWIHDLKCGNLYYTGLTGSARVGEQRGTAKRRKLSRDYSIELPVQVRAQGMNWFVIE